METIEPFDWQRIFIGRDNEYLFLLEICFRVVFIYVFAVFVMRYMGKRGNRGLSVFENVMIIALGSATGDSMFYPQVPLLYACVVIVVIVALSRLIQYLQLKYRKVNQFLDGTPIVLIRGGEIRQKGLDESRIREEELFGFLREQGIRDSAEVEFAFLERSGQVSVFPYDASVYPKKHDLIEEGEDNERLKDHPVY